MRQDQAKPKILKVWRCWGTPETRRNPIAPLMFYTDLCARHPDLLDFRCKGDPYHLIAGWITGEDRPRLAA
jgi:hypothetical protein